MRKVVSFPLNHLMIFNLLFDPGSHVLTVWELQRWVTNKAGDCSFKNYKA